MYLDIEFSKLFKNKHGVTIYNNIISEIKKERSESCDNNYIEAIFRVAFFGYIGLDENALNNMLKDINYKEDLAYINKIHKNSIRNIRNYIIEANKY